MELKAPENSQASRAGFVAQAYQVFLSGLPSRELRYRLLLWLLLLPSVLMVSPAQHLLDDLPWGKDMAGGRLPPGIISDKLKDYFRQTRCE